MNIKKQFYIIVSLIVSIFCICEQPLYAYNTIATYMSGIDLTREKETTELELLEEYEITIERDEDDERDRSVVIKKRSSEEVLDTEVEFTVFKDQKVIWIDSFYPNFPHDGVRGKGKELLKYLFNENTYPGHCVIAFCSDKKKANRFFLKEAVEALGYYEDVYSTMGDDGSSESFDIVSYRWKHALLSHDHGQHFRKDINLFFNIPKRDTVVKEYTIAALDREYDITSSSDKALGRSLNGRIYDKEHKTFLRTNIQYFVFPAQKVIYLYNFMPEFVGGVGHGKGRALLKKLFNHNNYPGYKVFCPLDINERRQRYLLFEAIKKMDYYHHVYSQFENAESKRSFLQLKEKTIAIVDDEKTKENINEADMCFTIPEKELTRKGRHSKQPWFETIPDTADTDFTNETRLENMGLWYLGAKKIKSLAEDGINTIEDVLYCSHKDFQKIPGIGKKLWFELHRDLEKHGFEWKKQGKLHTMDLLYGNNTRFETTLRHFEQDIPMIRQSLRKLCLDKGLMPIEIISASKSFLPAGYGARYSIHVTCKNSAGAIVVLKVFCATSAEFRKGSPKGLVANTQRPDLKHFPVFYDTGEISSRNNTLYYQIYQIIDVDQPPRRLSGLEFSEQVNVFEQLLNASLEGIEKLGIVLWDMKLDQFVINRENGNWVYIDIERHFNGDDFSSEIKRLMVSLQNEFLYYIQDPLLDDYKRSFDDLVQFYWNADDSQITRMQIRADLKYLLDEFHKVQVLIEERYGKNKKFTSIDMAETQKRVKRMEDEGVVLRARRSYYVRVLQQKIIAMIRGKFPHIEFNSGGLFYLLENTIDHEYLNIFPAEIMVRVHNDDLYAYLDIWGPAGEAFPKVLIVPPGKPLKWFTARSIPDSEDTNPKDPCYRGLPWMLDTFGDDVAVAWHYDVDHKGGVGVNDKYPHITTVRIPRDKDAVLRFHYTMYLEGLTLKSS